MSVTSMHYSHNSQSLFWSFHDREDQAIIRYRRLLAEKEQLSQCAKDYENLSRSKGWTKERIQCYSNTVDELTRVDNEIKNQQRVWLTAGQTMDVLTEDRQPIMRARNAG